MSRSAGRRARVEYPHQDAHDRSVERLATARATIPPTDVLLRWFVAGWSEEVPTSIHAAGVEWAGPGSIVRGDGSTERDPGGGSANGSPSFSGPFRRRVLEGKTGETGHPSSEGEPELGVAYETPMHQTVAYIGRRRPLLAAWLSALGRYGGDWRSMASKGILRDDAGSLVGIPDEYAEAITEVALRRCWLDYRAEPTGGGRYP